MYRRRRNLPRQFPVIFVAVFAVLAVFALVGADRGGYGLFEDGAEADGGSGMRGSVEGRVSQAMGSSLGQGTSRGPASARIVVQSLVPRIKKTHVVGVDVGALLAGGDAGHGDQGGDRELRGGLWALIRAVRWAWRPQYVRVRCEDARGAWIGVRVYPGMDNSAGDGGTRGGGRGDGYAKKKPLWCGWSYSVQYHVDHVGRVGERVSGRIGERVGDGILEQIRRRIGSGSDGDGAGEIGSDGVMHDEKSQMDAHQAPWCWVGLSEAGIGGLTVEAEGGTTSTVLTFYVEYVHQLSMFRLGLYVLGATLFLYAPLLARSLAFRLTAGSCGCIALSAMLVLFIVWRNVPQKRSFFVLATVWGGAAALLARLFKYLYRNAFDRGRLFELVSHPVVLAYVVTSGLVGMAVTYYMHDSRDEKMNNIVQAGLHLVGAGMMVVSATSWVAGVVWAGLVVIWSLWGAWHGKGSAWGGVKGSGEDTLTGERGVGWRGEREQRAGYRDHEGFGERGRYRAYEVRRAHGRDGEEEVERQWERTPKTGRHRLQVDLPGSRGWDHDGENDTERTPFTRTPRNESSTPTVFRVSTTNGVPPSPKDFPESERSKLHGLVRRGKILNVETDRTIAIGKSKYNELFLKGYEVNFESGEITPPSTRSTGGFR